MLFFSVKRFLFTVKYLSIIPFNLSYSETNFMKHIFLEAYLYDLFISCKQVIWMHCNSLSDNAENIIFYLFLKMS